MALHLHLNVLSSDADESLIYSYCIMHMIHALVDIETVLCSLLGSTLFNLETVLNIKPVQTDLFHLYQIFSCLATANFIY